MRRRLPFALPAALVLATAALAAPPLAWGQAGELEIKAAFLPKFARYVTLPPAVQPAAGQPFYLCILGRDPFGALIDAAAAREVVDDHPIAVRRFAGTGDESVAGCHFAFVAGASGEQTRRMLEALRARPVLTVTDSHDRGPSGMIDFVIADGRVRFTIDNAEAAARNITISARLLALAIDVRQKGA